MVQFLLAVIAGVIASLIVAFLSNWKRWKVAVIIGLVILVSLFAIFLQSPPLRASGVNWCLQQDETILISGRLNDWVLGSPLSNSVTDYSLQIKIFRVGADSPINSVVRFANPDSEGNFATEFPPTELTSSTGHLINTAFVYDTFFMGEKWSIKDFRRPDPSPCTD